MVFTGESRFCLHNNDRSVSVLYGPTIDTRNVTFHTPHYLAEDPLWCGVVFLYRTHRLSVHTQYILDVLEQHLVPFTPFIGENFLLMQDNAKPHVVQIVRNDLEEVEIHDIA